MNKEDSIRFVGLMEDYLHIPSFVCEMIQDNLENNNYKEVVEYVIARRNEIENKKDFISEQEVINMCIAKDKEIERLNNIINELEKYLNDDWTSVNGEIAVKLVKYKLKELKEGK